MAFFDLGSQESTMKLGEFFFAKVLCPSLLPCDRNARGLVCSLYGSPGSGKSSFLRDAFERGFFRRYGLKLTKQDRQELDRMCLFRDMGNVCFPGSNTFFDRVSPVESAQADAFFYKNSFPVKREAKSQGVHVLEHPTLPYLARADFVGFFLGRYEDPFLHLVSKRYIKNLAWCLQGRAALRVPEVALPTIEATLFLMDRGLHRFEESNHSEETFRVLGLAYTGTDEAVAARFQAFKRGACRLRLER